MLLTRTLGGTVGTALFGAVLAAGLPASGATRTDYADALPMVFLVAIPFGLARDRRRRCASRSTRCGITPASRDRRAVSGGDWRDTNRGRVPCRT